MKTKSSSSSTASSSPSPSESSGEGGSIIPKHIVHSFQIHQEDTKTSNKNESESESELNIQYYERNFPVGSMFNFNLQMSKLKLKLKTVRTAMFNEEDLDLSKPHQEQQINPSSFHIGEGAQLILKSLVLPPSYTTNNANAVPMSLWISTNVNPDYSCLSYNISSTDPIHTLRDLTIVGPATVKLALVKIGDAGDGDGDGAKLEHVTIFGNVKVCKEKERVMVIQANQTFIDLEHEVQADEDEKEGEEDNGDNGHDDDELKAKMNTKMNTKTKAVKRKSDKQEAAVIDHNTTPVKESKVTKKAKVKASSKIPSESEKETETATEKEKDTPNSKTKKRKLLSEDETTKQVENEAKKAETSSASPTLTLKKLTKKQRKKQAKEKEEQLSQAIAKEQGYDKQQKSNDKHKSADDEANNGRKRSLTKPRMIKGGINIQDILHGTGSTIRNGRKVSINYTGTFDNPESNRIFDKNTSKANPLTFRMGTGEVIRGLDRGLEGMRVGGERIIIVPPSMGYGEKGTGSKGGGSGGKKIPGGATLCFTVQLRSIGK